MKIIDFFEETDVYSTIENVKYLIELRLKSFDLTESEREFLSSLLTLCEES